MMRGSMRPSTCIIALTLVIAASNAKAHDNCDAQNSLVSQELQKLERTRDFTDGVRQLYESAEDSKKVGALAALAGAMLGERRYVWHFIREQTILIECLRDLVSENG